MIDWKRETAEHLREYPLRKNSVQSVLDELERLEAEAVSLRSASTDGTPVKGSGMSSREDRLISNIVARSELERTVQDTRDWLQRMDAALAQLTDEERLILDRCYMHKQYGGLDRLCTELVIDIRTLHRRKHEALRKLTLLLYGATET